MLVLILVILALLLFGGGGFYVRRSGSGPRGFVGLLIAALLVLLLTWVANELVMPPLPMPRGAPSIIN